MSESTIQSTNDSEKQTVVCVFCGACPGESPAYLAAARSLAQLFYANKVKLVYGGGTRGVMGELARTLVALAGPKAVQGIIPTALIKMEEANGRYGGKPISKPATTIMRGTERECAAEVSGNTEKEERAKGRPKEPERVVRGAAGTQSTEASLELQENEYGMTMLVPDMHTRKAEMAKMVMEGGPGSGFAVLPGGFGTLEEAMEVVTWNQLGIHSRGIALLNVEGYWNGILSWIDKAIKEGFVGELNKDIMVECGEPTNVLEVLKKYRPAAGRFDLDWKTPKVF